MNTEAKSTEDKTQRVVCAAIRHSEGAIICGPRHFDATMHAQISAQGGDWRRAAQGFVDQFGSFLTREQAFAIATAQSQIFRELEHVHGELYSEHLY